VSEVPGPPSVLTPAHCNCRYECNGVTSRRLLKAHSNPFGRTTSTTTTQRIMVPPKEHDFRDDGRCGVGGLTNTGLRDHEHRQSAVRASDFRVPSRCAVP
jgi:hypothetical protein